jgi:hypothetical protein
MSNQHNREKNVERSKQRKFSHTHDLFIPSGVRQRRSSLEAAFVGLSSSIEIYIEKIGQGEMIK